jgi:hypothetical protein
MMVGGAHPAFFYTRHLPALIGGKNLTVDERK